MANIEIESVHNLTIVYSLLLQFKTMKYTIYMNVILHFRENNSEQKSVPVNIDIFVIL